MVNETFAAVVEKPNEVYSPTVEQYHHSYIISYREYS